MRWRGDALMIQFSMLEGKGDTEREHLFTKTACSIRDGRVSTALNVLPIILLKLVAL